MNKAVCLLFLLSALFLIGCVQQAGQDGAGIASRGQANATNASLSRPGVGGLTLEEELSVCSGMPNDGMTQIQVMFYLMQPNPVMKKLTPSPTNHG